MSLNSCVECGERHAIPNEHIFTYVESNDKLNKRGLVDSITLEPFIAPVDLSCGHTFSQHSIGHVFLTTKACPECRTESSTFNETSRIIRSQVNQLDVWCPRKCGINVERHSLRNHLADNCPNIKQHYCPNKYKEESCKFYGIRHDLEKHKNECLFRVIDCEGKCGLVLFQDPNHNCITFLSQKTKKIMEIITQMLIPELKTYQSQIKESNSKITQLESQISVQNTHIRSQNTQISVQSKDIDAQNIKIANQNRYIAEQSRRIVEQSKTITEQSRKIEDQSSYTNIIKIHSLLNFHERKLISHEGKINKLILEDSTKIQKEVHNLIPLHQSQKEILSSSSLEGIQSTPHEIPGGTLCYVPKTYESVQESSQLKKRPFYLLEPTITHDNDGDNYPTCKERRLL